MEEGTVETRLEMEVHYPGGLTTLLRLVGADGTVQDAFTDALVPEYAPSVPVEEYRLDRRQFRENINDQFDLEPYGPYTGKMYSAFPSWDEPSPYAGTGIVDESTASLCERMEEGAQTAYRLETEWKEAEDGERQEIASEAGDLLERMTLVSQVLERRWDIDIEPAVDALSTHTDTKRSLFEPLLKDYADPVILQEYGISEDAATAYADFLYAGQMLDQLGRDDNTGTWTADQPLYHTNFREASERQSE